ncbi:FAD-binding oxidoreductase [Rheinheimera riviphila]|uniref:FAD-binding oxidoreductase n=1 Tax=Rheinheimera riviphila TaxID=1834037 RepID=A0A437QM09_9GAMM|nr:FAD-binding protein [Rheinheimera riviphila]RVU35522.1 FAD-binding oxidoreductase [Rheinheimera riviphila]
MKRRDFLLLSAATLAGCQLSQQPTFPGAAHGNLALPEAADWQLLSQQLTGDVLFPVADDFSRQKKAANARYDDVPTAVIIRCQTAADVQHAVRFIQRYQLPFAVRSGGHSYTGLSSTSGVLLDIGLLNQITLHQNIASIGAGAKLGDVYATLGLQQRSIPAGSCASVGIAGLVLGGGLGIADRRFGLTCDALRRVELVTATGELIYCSTTEHPQLFWALRGGGGGQFGIATQFEFDTFETAPIRNFIGRFPLKDGNQVLAIWQQWLKTLPDEIWSQATVWFNGQPDSKPEIQLRACCMGHPALLSQHWYQLTLQLAGIWSEVDMQDHQYLDFMLTDCDGLEMPECKLPNQHERGQLKRVAMAGSSDIFNDYLPLSGLHHLLNAVRKRHQDGFRGGLMLTSMGGAIRRVPPGHSAFAHRAAVLSAQYLFSGPVGTPEVMLQEGAIWVNQMRKQMRRWSCNGAYLNYTDALIKDWPQAYYGDNYVALQQLKRQYDPDNLFRFAQSIQPD